MPPDRSQPGHPAGPSDPADAPPGARRRLVDLPGRDSTLSLLEWGEPGRPIVLLSHANGFCAASWAEFAEALAGRLHLVAIDARGQGHSPDPAAGVTPESLGWGQLRDDLIDVSELVLGETGQARIALGAGHSFGGTLTLAAAARAPGRFGALLALDPVILPPRIPGGGRGSDLGERARKRRARFPSRAEARASFAPKPLFAGWTPRALDLYVDFGLADAADSSGEVVLRCAPEVEATIFESAVEFDMLEEATRIEAPAEILWAEHGNFPRALHEGVADRMPRGRVVPTDAGHLVLMENPALVVDAAERMLAETPVSPP